VHVDLVERLPVRLGDHEPSSAQPHVEVEILPDEDALVEVDIVLGQQLGVEDGSARHVRAPERGGRIAVAVELVEADHCEFGQLTCNVPRASAMERAKRS
jgi:hypothetical protein